MTPTVKNDPTITIEDGAIDVDLDELIRTEEAAIARQRPGDFDDPAVLRAQIAARDAEIGRLQQRVVTESESAAEAARKNHERDVEDFIRRGRDEGKITPAMAAGWREDAMENLPKMKTRLAMMPVILDRRGPQPPLGFVGGQLWEDLTASEMADLQNKDPAKFEALLAEYRARKPRIVVRAESVRRVDR